MNARFRSDSAHRPVLLVLALLSCAPAFLGWSWDLDDVPELVRDRVHLHANEVPPLPGDDLPLGNPLAWPEKMVLDDYLCTLRVREVNGTALMWVASLQHVRPGTGFALSYVCAPADNWDATRGPHYMWNSEGTLIERYWVTADTLRDIVTGIQNYTSSRLFRYYHREDVKDPTWFDPRGPFEWFDEFFAEDGNLIGFAASKADADAKYELVAYWMGEKVDYDEFQSLKRDLYARVYP